MGIVLLVLKIIGIILLCILGLFLLILLLALFSPVTYKVMACGSMESYKIKAKVGWFLNIFRVNVCFKDGKLKMRVKVLWIPFNMGAKSDNNVERGDGSSVPQITENIELDTTVDEIVEVQEEEQFVEPEEKNKSFKDKIKNLFKREKKPKLTEEEKQWQKDEKARLKAEKKEAAKRAREEKIKQIKEYISKGKEAWAYLQEAETKEAIALVKDVLKKVLKHVLPRKFKGQVNFGLEDPADTGLVLAAVSAAYPMHKGNLMVRPYFDTDKIILDGKAQAKGHIIMCYMLIQGLRILMNNRIMTLIKQARNK